MPLTDADRFGTDLDLPIVDDDELLLTPTGDLRTRSGRGNLRLALQQRALTARGDLLHRPDYGGGLPEAVELPSTPAARSELGARVRSNALRDSRVREATVSVSAGLPDDSGAPSVTVEIIYKTSVDGAEGESLSVELTE